MKKQQSAGVAPAVPVKQRAERLNEIASAIRAELPMAIEGFRQALPHAIRIGDCLIEAKGLLDHHGEWLRWLDANVNIKHRACQGYMRLARWRKAHPNASLDEGINVMLRRIGRRPRKVTVAQVCPAGPMSPRIELVSIDQLKPHPRNYKTHTPEQIEHLIQSITEHGILRPVIVARDGTILAGHGIVEAVREINRRREAAAAQCPITPPDPIAQTPQQPS